MAEHGGLVQILDEPRRGDRIREIIDRRGTYTDAVSSLDDRAGSLALCLLSLDGNYVSAACLATTGNRIASAKSLLRLSRFVHFDPIGIREYTQSAAARVRANVTRTLRAEEGRLLITREPLETYRILDQALSRFGGSQRERIVSFMQRYGTMSATPADLAEDVLWRV